MAKQAKPSPLHPVFSEPVFADPGVTPDPLGFQTPHPSDNATYAQVEQLLKAQVVDFPRSRLPDDAIFPLAAAYGDRGSDVVSAIQSAGRIVFHAVGDTGASDVRRYQNEVRVADQLSVDAVTPEVGNRPAFFFHLGDVVYNFGEARYYYDQFYEPYRAYPAPIFAIPGNHDSFIVPGTPTAAEPLKTFMRNFCAPSPTVSPDAGSLHRTATTVPGVYFALEAPFVRIIGLFSNALEDPGVVSSEGGRWPGVPDTQLEFLGAQLRAIKQQAYKGAVILATHHPPFVYAPPPDKGARSSNHGSSTDMLRDIDRVCAAEGIYPHAVFSAHAHNYQRYTRTLAIGGAERQVPFVVCGNGGHNINPIVRPTRNHPAPEPQNGADVGYLDVNPAVNAAGLTFERYDDHNYGYLRVSVDDAKLRIAYHQAGVRTLLQSRFDLVTVDLASHRLMPD